MEETKKTTSCLMLAANLETPVSLTAVFDSEDLKDTGIEFDSHITILYARDKFLEKMELLDNIMDVGSKATRDDILTYISKQRDFAEYAVPVLDLFELGNFENDSGYVVLKLKKDNEWFPILSTLNKGLMEKYGITSDFPNYTPHLTLAELEPGTTEKYINSETLKLILRGSLVHFEDFIVSYDTGDKVYKVHNLTTNHAVDRFFRIRELRNEAMESE